jgi:hypothetical protein
VTEMSIGGEDYEGSITPVRSDISRFSRGTVMQIATCRGFCGAQLYMLHRFILASYNST